jgi:hypothetical protein
LGTKREKWSPTILQILLIFKESLMEKLSVMKDYIIELVNDNKAWVNEQYSGMLYKETRTFFLKARRRDGHTHLANELLKSIPNSNLIVYKKEFIKQIYNNYNSKPIPNNYHLFEDRVFTYKGFFSSILKMDYDVRGKVLIFDGTSLNLSKKDYKVIYTMKPDFCIFLG